MSETDKDFIERLGNELRLSMYFGVDRSEHKRLVALASRAVEKLAGADGDPLTPDQAWQDLVEKDDRNSPSEYPDMALITFEELTDYMTSATPSSPATDADTGSIRDALENIIIAFGMGWDLNGVIEVGRSALTKPSPVTEADEILRGLVEYETDRSEWEPDMFRRCRNVWDRARAYVSKGGA